MNRSYSAIIKSSAALFLGASLLIGCAITPLPTQSDRMGDSGIIGNCVDFFTTLDRLTENTKVIDPGVFRVEKYPYLRVNRFLASFDNEVDNRVAFGTRINHMQTLDQDARKFEIANLSSSAVAELDASGDRVKLHKKVVACGDLLKSVDFQNSKHLETSGVSISVPDEYISLRRIFGIYPFTRLFVSSGVSRWHSETRQSFSAEPPADWQTIRFVPIKHTGQSSLDRILEQTKRDALGIPIYSAEARLALFQMFAPVWEIQLRGNFDRIGQPFWNGQSVLDVDIDRPTTYTLMSFTRFNKEIFTQLNYVIWFPARPKEGAFDIYGGKLDGITYRVTLNNSGKPLVYETMHNCGCYYKAYPTPNLRAREKIDYAEPPLILAAPEVNHDIDFLVVAMESRTHYIQHLYSFPRKSKDPAALYTWNDYDRLRSLPHHDGRQRSMFGQNSIAPGSQRLERFILWPTGVFSPGAMRQWGRHAVAFVGKRHFDDPFYLDKMFKIAKAEPKPPILTDQ